MVGGGGVAGGVAAGGGVPAAKKAKAEQEAAKRKAEEQGKAAPALMEAYRENLWPWLQTERFMRLWAMVLT